jgi:hypothetical protein
MIYIYWILVTSLACAVIGWGLFTGEVLQDRIRRKTIWSELNHYQLAVVMLANLGCLVFVGTLIVVAIFKS